MKRWIGWITLLALLLGCCPGLAQGASAIYEEPEEYTEGYLWYMLENGSATVTYCDLEATGSIVIPEAVEGCPVTAIGEYAFAWCENVTSVTIPASVTAVGVGAFCWMPALTGISADAKNTAYCSDEKGVLFNKDKTVLVQAPGGLSGAYTIPEGVTEIAGNAFAGCYRMSCVTVPLSVTGVGDEAFDGCQRLSDVYYPGSQAQLREIQWGVDNESLTEATIHYGIETPDDEPELPEVPDVTEPEEDVAYIYTVQDGEATITGCTGELIGDVVIPEELDGYPVVAIGNSALQQEAMTSVVIPDSVISIGDYAFSCSGLKTVVVPDSVVSIGKNVFSQCKDLEVAVLPEGIPAVPYGTFLECTKLEAVRIPMNVKTIEMHAFLECTNLKNLVLPSSVTEIAKDAFARCTYLRLIAFSENVQSIGAGAFDGCQNLNQVYYGGTQAQWAQITIGERNSPLSAATVHFEQEMPYGSEEPDMMDFLTFSDKGEEVKLSQCVPTFGGSMLIPEEYEQQAVTSISDWAFRDCVYMDMVLIPDTVTMIGESAFKNCLSMVLAYAGEGTETIQASAFANCVNLGAIFLPANLQAIDKTAFLNCNGLEIVFYDGTQEQWEAISIAEGNDALAQAEIMYEWSSMEEPEEYVDGYVTYIIENEEAIVYYCDEEAVGSIQIPAMVEDYPVTAIDEYAFAWCEGITSISFADTVAVIGESAFEGCAHLTDVSLPAGLTTIGDRAFASCGVLRSIDIPASVTSIGASAFERCYALSTVYLPAGLQNIGDRAFRYCSVLTIYVPAGSPAADYARQNDINCKTLG